MLQIKAFVFFVGVASAKFYGQYCERETFEATCGEDEVIVMRHALYGRMRIGRCVTRDRGSLGCSSDALHHADRFCSGRRRCSFQISSLHEMIDVHECPADLMCYLEASYDCVTVYTCKQQTCRNEMARQLAPTSGYLSSLSAAEAGCGTAPCPWLLRLKPGQSVNFTTYNYVIPPIKRHEFAKSCYRLATIRNPATRQTTVLTACKNDARQNSLLVGEATTLEIHLHVPSSTATKSYFLVKYHLSGCPVIAAPPGGWLQQQKDQLVVRCNSSDRVWRLMCSGTSWVGDVGQCLPLSAKSTKWSIARAFSQVTASKSIMLMVALGVALGILLGFFLLFVTAMYMRRSRAKDEVRQYERVGYGRSKPSIESNCSPRVLRHGQSSIGDSGVCCDVPSIIGQTLPGGSFVEQLPKIDRRKLTKPEAAHGTRDYAHDSHSAV